MPETQVALTPRDAGHAPAMPVFLPVMAPPQAGDAAAAPVARGVLHAAPPRPFRPSPGGRFA